MLSNVLNEISKDLKSMSVEEKVDYINDLKIAIHKQSPMKNEPVDCVLWVKKDNVHANDYNPNSVAPPEMELLRLSIEADWYTQPIVGFDEWEKITVVDWFHRNRVGKECESITKRIHWYLPMVKINQERTGKWDRIASTVRHNRARGKHSVDWMAELVLDLKKRNWSDKKIAKNLGMDPDEVLRLSQITGLAEMFSNKEFSEAWEADVLDYDQITDEENIS